MTTTRTYRARAIAALGETASLGLLINAVSDSLAVMAAGLDLYLMSKMAGDTPLDSYGAFPDPTGLAMMTGLARIVMLVVTFITSFIVLKWIYRANRNAHAFARGLNSKPPWAVAWYFIPVAALWKPFEAMEETWKVSHGPEGWKARFTPDILRQWWGFWLAGSLIGNVAFRMGFRVGDVQGMMWVTGLELASSAFFVVCGLILRRIVEDVTRAQTGLIGADQA